MSNSRFHPSWRDESHTTNTKGLSSYAWKDQIDALRAKEDFAADLEKHKKKNGFNRVMKLLKDADRDKMRARGKRVPLGDVSSKDVQIRINNLQKLQKKGESKRALKKIQNNLPELC